ncbi:MAG TPA: thioredoxin, partial [Ignavibacteriaceae bacterium]|nr:thioredoxin [Ignavibacteriaceae bacterium]
MNNKLLNTFSEFQNIVESKKAVCFYLSTPECNV